MAAPVLAVFGRNRATEYELQVARKFGERIALAGAVLLTGGTGTGAREIKEQAIEGAIAADGAWIGVENSHAPAVPRRVRGGIVVSPGVGHRRNYVGAALCDAAVALSGEDGTASEIVFALALRRPTVLYGWTPTEDLRAAAHRKVPATGGPALLDRLIASAYAQPLTVPEPTSDDVTVEQVVASLLDHPHQPMTSEQLLGLTDSSAWDAVLAGRSQAMTEPDDANLDDVLPTTEQAIPDRHEHAKTPKRLNDDALEHRTEQERVAAGLEDYDPDQVPDAEA